MTNRGQAYSSGGTLNSLGLPSLRSKVKVATIGSSYTQHQTVLQSSVNFSKQSRSWGDWWNVFTGNALNLDVFVDAADPLSRGFRGSNFGVSGEDSTAILARIGSVIAKRPHLCVLQSGTNNVTAVETVVADVIATINALYNAGILAVYLSINFRGAGSTWTLTTQKNASWVNARIKDYLATTGKGIYVESNKYLCDMDSAEGRPLSSALDTDDIHYNTWSGFQIGRVLHECVTPILTLQGGDISSNADLYDATNNPFGNEWVNPFVSTSSNIGSSNGTVGTGVTAGTGSATTSVGRNMTVERNSGSGTAVANIEARTPGLGNWQTSLFTPAGSGTSLFYTRSNSSDITHALAEGTWVKGGVSVDLSTFGTDAKFSGFQNVMLKIDFRSAGASLGRSEAMSQYSAISLPNVAWNGVLETPPYQIPVGCDRVRVRLETIIDDTKTGTGLLKASGFYFRPLVSAPSAIW